MNPLSSLGVGSGVLNYDIIDKLKKADENAQIAPIDRKLQQNIEKQTELVGLKTMLSSLQQSARKVADYSSYLARNATSSDESVLKVSANAGVPVQDIRVKVNEIAKNSVSEMGLKFSSRDDLFAKFNTRLRFHINGKDYSIKITESDTLSDVAQKIIDDTKGEVNASIMKTGDGEGAYSLMLSSKETGAANNLFIGTTLTSMDISRNALAFQEGDFSITLVDSNGNNRVISVQIPATNAESNQNANIIKDAILSSLNQDTEFATLVKNGDINVSLSGDGRRVIINDRRGFGIEAGGAKASELFTQTRADEEDTLVGTSAISAGLISGTISIDGNEINLGSITSSGNSQAQNERAIVDAINAIGGHYAKINADGYLAINTTNGEVNITARDSESDTLQKLGLTAGTYKDYGAFSENLGIKTIQEASNANLTYNGANVSRASNTIDDIVNGVTLDLIAPSEKDINISIGRDNTMIIDEIKAFVEGYNALVPKLDELTRYDEDTKIAGIFNGVSDIRTIRGDLHRALARTNFTEGRYESMINYGLSFNDDGILILDESRLRGELASNPDKVMKFFRGGEASVNGRSVEMDGVFSLVNKQLDALVSGENAKLKLFEESLTNDDKRLKDDKKRNLELLDSRYETMANRFAAYDSQIAKANNAFKHLDMMIEQSIAEKKK